MKELLHPVYQNLVTEVKMLLPCYYCNTNDGEEKADEISLTHMLSPNSSLKPSDTT